MHIYKGHHCQILKPNVAHQSKSLVHTFCNMEQPAYLKDQDFK